MITKIKNQLVYLVKEIYSTEVGYQYFKKYPIPVSKELALNFINKVNSYADCIVIDKEKYERIYNAI